MVADTERGPIRTAAIANLGCKVNQAEMEAAVERAARDRVVGRILGLSPPPGARAHAD